MTRVTGIQNLEVLEGVGTPESELNRALINATSFLLRWQIFPGTLFSNTLHLRYFVEARDQKRS
jgi:hypothetical protein